MFGDMLDVFVEHFVESVIVGVSHCLDDKLFVLTEEKETSTLALGFSSLEDRLNILSWVQTVFDAGLIKTIEMSQILEYSRCNLMYLHFLLQEEV